MPPRDVGALVLRDGGAELEPSASASASCGGCETALSTADHCDPYAPAESLRLRIGEDIDWSDVGQPQVLERDDSTKGAAANPKCAARRSAGAATATAGARSSLSGPSGPVAVAVVIGSLLPAATAGKGKGKAARDQHGRRRRLSPCQLQLQLQLGGGTRVFASSSGEAMGNHQAPAAAEPWSPKVSCLGGVRSQPRTAAEGTASGHRRWAWPVAGVMFCWKGRRRNRKPRASEA